MVQSERKRESDIARDEDVNGFAKMPRAKLRCVRYVWHSGRHTGNKKRERERERMRKHITNMHLRPIVCDTPVQTTLYIKIYRTHLE